jgi:hypothetical protein
MSENTVTKGSPVHDGGSDYDLLFACVEQAKRAYATLDDLVSQPDQRGGGEFARPASYARAWPSWNATAAYLTSDLRQLTRLHENRLLARGAGTARHRGASNANTFLSLDALPRLAHAAGQDEVHETLSALSSWLRRAREALGEVEPLTRLPRLPGAPEPRCPWCERMTLRQQPHAGIVRCVNPTCRDTDGRRPLARVELGRLSLEPLLTWTTGEVGL